MSNCKIEDKKKTMTIIIASFFTFIRNLNIAENKELKISDILYINIHDINRWRERIIDMRPLGFPSCMCSNELL